MQIKEQDLLAPVSQYAHRKGFRLQQHEMPFYSYRIDVYGYSKNTQSTIAIELKLRNWRRALQQAVIYQLCSDYVYIALPRSSMSRIEAETLKRHGIGLISVSSSGCRTVIPAKQSMEVRKYYRDPFIVLLEGEVGARSKPKNPSQNGHSR